MTARVRTSTSKPVGGRNNEASPSSSATPAYRGRSPSPIRHYPETARRLRYLLNTHGRLQRHLAQLCGRTEGCVSTWLSGKSRPRTADLERIAREFNVTIDWILGKGKLRGGA